jgi:hypothetical protein
MSLLNQVRLTGWAGAGAGRGLAKARARRGEQAPP